MLGKTLLRATSARWAISSANREPHGEGAISSDLTEYQNCSRDRQLTSCRGGRFLRCCRPLPNAAAMMEEQRCASNRRSIRPAFGEVRPGADENCPDLSEQGAAGSRADRRCRSRRHTDISAFRMDRAPPRKAVHSSGLLRFRRRNDGTQGPRRGTVRHLENHPAPRRADMGRFEARRMGRVHLRDTAADGPVFAKLSLPHGNQKFTAFPP